MLTYSLEIQQLSRHTVVSGSRMRPSSFPVPAFSTRIARMISSAMPLVSTSQSGSSLLLSCCMCHVRLSFRLRSPKYFFFQDGSSPFEHRIDPAFLHAGHHLPTPDNRSVPHNEFRCGSEGWWCFRHRHCIHRILLRCFQHVDARVQLLHAAALAHSRAKV